MVSSPRAPDPYATAATQSLFDKQTAIAQAGLNSTDQVGPDGSLNYSQVGTWADGTPHYQATQTLSPAAQQVHDLNDTSKTNFAQLGATQSGQLNNTLTQPFQATSAAMNGQLAGSGMYDPVRTAQERRYTDATAPQSRYSDATAPQVQYTDPNAPAARYVQSNDQLAGQLYGAGMARLGPQLQQQHDATQAELANKGLTAGSTAYDRSMQQENQRSNDAMNSLFLNGQGQAFNQGLQRVQNDFGQDMTRANYTMGANQQNFGQDLAGKQYTLAANQQNFGQDLAGKQYTMGANQQNFGQDMTANDQNFNQQIAQNNMLMAQRNQALNEMTTARQEPINEITALQSGSQIAPQRLVSTPQTAVAPTNYTQAVQSNYQQQMQQYNGLLSGLGSIAATGLKAGIGAWG